MTRAAAGGIVEAMTTAPTIVDAAGAPPLAGASPAECRNCRNCGTRLEGPYCAQGGQRAEPLDPTLVGALRDMVQEATDVDGRLATTIRALLVPGRLTREWVAGRRVRYFSPLKLYLTVSVLFFLASAVSPVKKRAVTHEDRPAAGTAAAGTTAAAASHSEAGPPSATVATPRGRTGEDELPEFMRGGLRNVAKDPDAFERRVEEWAPRIFFLLVPLFAGSTALLYRSRRRRMPQHLWLALHVHAFAFLLGVVAEVVEMTRVATLDRLTGIAILIAFPTYVATSLRAVYGGSWGGAVARTAALGLSYLAGAILLSLFALGALLAVS